MAKPKTRKDWTDAERQKLAELRAAGLPLREIIKSFPDRTYTSIAVAKYQQKNSPAISFNGTSYKDVLPQWQWPRMEHFLKCFTAYGIIAQEMGKGLNAGVFLTEYMKVFGKRGLR